VVAAVTDIASVRDGVVTAGTQIASTRNAATQAAATQSFFMHLIMPPMRDFRREVNQKIGKHFLPSPVFLKGFWHPVQTIHDASVTCAADALPSRSRHRSRAAWAPPGFRAMATAMATAAATRGASPCAVGIRNHRKHCATRGGIVFFHHIRNVGWVDAH
jgi:hypothetical protein